MSSTWWSWVTFAASALGVWISGNNPKLGWRYGIAIQLVVWGPSAWFTHRWGDAALAATFVFVYSRNLRRWRHTDIKRQVKPKPEPEQELAA